MSMTTELIKNLRKQKDNLYLKTSDGRATYPLELILQAANVIEELSTKLHASQMERSSQYYHCGWIPVDERLPEKPMKCLVHEQNYGGEKDADLHDAVEHIVEWNGKMWIGTFYQEECSNITAWRPLPEPYKAESEE